MSERVMPDSLVNTLVRHRDGTVRRVIRDDGRNGLKISQPDEPTSMYPISLEEFENDWELHMTVEEQLKDNGPEVEDRERPFRGQHAVHNVTTGADLSSQVQLPSVDSRNGVDSMADTTQRFGALGSDPFDGRTEPTPRGEDAEEFTKHEPEDRTITGEPVGGNEEPAELFEEERADDATLENASEPQDNSPDAEEGDTNDKPKRASRKK